MCVYVCLVEVEGVLHTTRHPSLQALGGYIRETGIQTPMHIKLKHQKWGNTWDGYELTFNLNTQMQCQDLLMMRIRATIDRRGSYNCMYCMYYEPLLLSQRLAMMKTHGE